ncbi:MAG TPA: hypothetical protein ENK98_05260 [Epsilonproteobacteria bacterium]|nr:hypothetical protein [Campylobacterota bacterium]
MQLKYTNQPHQTKAINSIVSLFQGQSRQVCEYDIFDGEAVCGNGYILDDVAILENLQRVQRENAIEESLMLQSRDFSVEMETGTGKTYVYIKSILELYEKYGWNKYIIIMICQPYFRQIARHSMQPFPIVTF